MPDEETDSQISSEERTDLAEDRTIMAMERTFAGWMRTAFAAIGIGLAFRGLFGAVEPSWLPRVVATLFILTGAFVAYSAERRAARTFERLSAHYVDRSKEYNLRWMAYATIAGAVILTVAVWAMASSA